MRRVLTKCLNVQAALGLLAVSFILALAAYCVEGYDDLWTCAVCRMNRVHHVYAGQCWSTTFREADCTSWYRKNVDSEHSHVWVHARSTAYKNLYGIRHGAIDRDPIGRTIWQLTPRDHIGIYSHAATPRDGVQLVLALTSPELKDNNQDYVLLRDLESWKASGYKLEERPSLRQ